MILLLKNTPQSHIPDPMYFLASVKRTTTCPMITGRKKSTTALKSLGSSPTGSWARSRSGINSVSIKKNLDHSRLVSEKTTSSYQQEFRKIAMDMAMINSYEGWAELYQKLIYWELELENIEDSGMFEILESQKLEANNQFCKFIDKNYPDWFSNNADAPVMSHKLFKEKVVPEISTDQPTLMVVIDNLRYDQWKAFEPIVNNYFKKEKEDAFYSILPTATQYARNAIFSGLMPSEMEKQFPNYWLNDTDEGGKNMFENEFLNYLRILLFLKQILNFYLKISRVYLTQHWN